MKLNAPYGSSAQELKDNFHILAKKCHPDVCKNKEWANEEFKELVSDFKSRLKSKEQKSAPPPPKQEFKPRKTEKRSYSTTLVTVAIGHNAIEVDGKVYIKASIERRIKRLTVYLIADDLLDLTKKKSSDNFTFSFSIPFDHRSGDIITINNLPFPCEVKVSFIA